MTDSTSLRPVSLIQTCSRSLDSSGEATEDQVCRRHVSERAASVMRTTVLPWCHSGCTRGLSASNSSVEAPLQPVKLFRVTAMSAANLLSNPSAWISRAPVVAFRRVRLSVQPHRSEFSRPDREAALEERALIDLQAVRSKRRSRVVGNLASKHSNRSSGLRVGTPRRPRKHRPLRMASPLSLPAS